MDNGLSSETTSKTGLPKGGPFVPAETTPATVAPSDSATVAAAEGDRTGVFQHLVKDDADIVGLVAYSIYKQNKLDWLRAFEKAKNRAPNDDELGSYIVGEGTPRRLATYRHLAEATLAGNGPEIDGTTQSKASLRRFAGDRSTLSTSVVASYALIAILFLVLLWVAFHFTMSSR